MSADEYLTPEVHMSPECDWCGEPSICTVSADPWGARQALCDECYHRWDNYDGPREPGDTTGDRIDELHRMSEARKLK